MAKQIRTGQHIPDILDCLAQLSNDEVPTPPKLARSLLDLLPGEVWGRADYVWLDPFCKSGIFLREIAARLLDGLSEQIPNFEERREHIYRKMLWGTAITEMTGMISRRSLYYSRNAKGPTSVVQSEREDGNLPFIQTSHTFPMRADGTVSGACLLCGAPIAIERGEDRENHAYSFIHGTYPTEELKTLKFDVIIGNPPYQLEDTGNGVSATPIYQHFVRQAIRLNPKYLVMITPSRWFAGGKWLNEYRAGMIADRHIQKLIDNPKLFDCFPGVEIKGGVSYFLWSRDHDGDCEFSTRVDGVVTSTATRDLREGAGVLLRDNTAIPVVHRVTARGEPTVDQLFKGRTPFGIQTSFKQYVAAGTDGAIRVHRRERDEVWTTAENVPTRHEWIKPIKVLITKAADGHGRVPAAVLGNPFVADGNSVCTDTFLIARLCKSTAEAEYFSAYLRTKFVRFLVHQRKPTQDTRGDQFTFVPDLPMDHIWTDPELYERYEFTPSEIAYVESQIRSTVAPEGDAEDE